ncbi:hypothetical protein HDA32_004033 [Spinactinospora alkalitolerans]|uniref:Uncharacterized protein n=1 Tax=Spinactinospora alkalitolerans TaxID=687207 RepID=A0A852U1R5_9ACTN|nr:hypothetical protein [Spinactinospora alkalitolerans]NYE48913.1 hypothetical protein [Spinactinospora alkalitolerans]
MNPQTGPGDTADDVLLHGEAKASYFWDDGSGINGDTGAPASGEPMQKGLFASPSWPLGTEGYIEYDGKKAEFFIGDRGPGAPSEDCDVMLDLDGKTFAELTGGSWDGSGYRVEGFGAGHIEVSYHITEWGDGAGEPGAPHPFSDPSNPCDAEVPADSADSADSEGAEGSGEPGSDGAQQTGEGSPSPEQAVPESGEDSAGSEQVHPALDLMANESPALSGAVLVALIAALTVVVLAVRRRFAPALTAGRHRKPSFLSRVGSRRY